MPIKSRLVLIHATAVVPLPKQLSRTVSPSFVYVLIKYSNRGTGFCVGCTLFVLSALENVWMLFGYFKSVLSSSYVLFISISNALDFVVLLPPLRHILPFSICGLYVLCFLSNTKIFSCDLSICFFANIGVETVTLFQMISYLNILGLLITKALVKGCEPVKTIAPLSFIILSYSFHNNSKGIISSHLHFVVP